MIPDFQSLMRPVLESVRDGNKHAIRDVIEHLSDRFNLTEAERLTVMEKSRQRVMYNRCHWAVTHLVKAGLLARPGRGVIEITDVGRAELAAASLLNMARLRTISPEYRTFVNAAAKGASDGGPPTPVKDVSPEEALATAYATHRRLVADELLEQLLSSPPSFFERVVIDLLQAMGYGRYRRDAATHLGGPHDKGVDGVIREDRLGLDVIYVQAKRWEGAVGRETVQAFAGSLEGHRAKRGVVITTSHFTASAQEYVAGIEKRIALIDGAQLAELMIDHGVGVEDEVTYTVKKVDHDYFELT